MRVDLAGKVRNTQLPRYKALLPMFEAVVNSFQAIEDRLPTTELPYITIQVEREIMLPGSDLKGDVSQFSVIDNGIGFTDENLESFFTSDTRHKVRRGGKGVGRFLWLKAFEQAEIESNYLVNGGLRNRRFLFSTADPEATSDESPSTETAPKTVVRLLRMRSPYKDNCPLTLQLIGHRLIEHCLPFFIDPNCPAVTLVDEQERIDLNSYFRVTFAAGASQHNFRIGSEEFGLRGLRVYNPHETHHRLIYAANSREVLQDKLERYLPNLQRRLSDEKGSFAYLGFLEGPYLDSHVNSERTTFSFPVDATNDGLLGEEISLENIRKGALTHISKDLQPFLEDINTEKRTIVNSYITQEAPEYRPLARYLDEFIDRIPPGTRGFNLEVILHEQMYLKQRALKQEGYQLIDNDSPVSLKPAEYEAKLNDFLERANELGKSSLAQYVAHRKVILDFLEKSLQSDPETGKYPLEEVIHRIIYPMRSTSEDVPYEQQNLWIIDERLAYHWYLASDMRLDTTSILENHSQARPDIMIFERALTFTEDDALLNSLVIVEFKKPNRNDYKEDPVDQVFRLVRDIKSGHFKDKDGREIKVASDRIPAYAYVVCDVTKEVEHMAENKGMLPTPDNLGFFGYNPKLSAYVEIISYPKLLRDAKRRNRILFDKLHLPNVSK